MGEDPSGGPAFSGDRHALLAVFAVVLFAFHLYTSFFGLQAATVQRGVHWGLMGGLLFLAGVLRVASWRERLWLLFCLVGLTGATLWLLCNWQRMGMRHLPPQWQDILWGGILIVVTLEVARRCLGLFLPMLAVIFILYAMLGPYMPGLLKHKGYSLSRIISYLYSTSSGLYGIPMGVSATYIVLFVFFGAFLNASGAGKLLMECSLALTGRFTGGAAKTAVIASALMGTMSGSPIANAVTTGTITIPLMRKSGMDKNMACAVEAVSSTGGTLMPPVMGAAAFIMAEYLHVEYYTLIKAAFLPAVVYFASIYITVDLYARKHGIGASRKLGRGIVPVLLGTGHLLLPIVLLVLCLMRGYSAMTAVVWSLVALVAVSWIRPGTQLSPGRCLTAIMEGAKNTAPVAAACAVSGIILGIISLTGIGSTLSSALFANFTGFLPGALIMSMVIALILGMGMPTTAVYIVLATLLAPSLVRLGVTPLAAHMFLFYFGIISTITPPIALTAYAAAAVGGGDSIKVGTQAFLLGIAAYCIPFVLVYAPEMMLTGSLTTALLRFAVCLAAVFAFSLAHVGFIRKRMALLCRVVAALAGLLLITPNIWCDLAGVAMLILVFILHRMRSAYCVPPTPPQ